MRMPCSSFSMRPMKRGEARLGMAVSIRAAGNAVNRNRLRRLIRESFRMHREEMPAVDVLVTARAAAATGAEPGGLRKPRAPLAGDQVGAMKQLAQLPIHLYRWFLSPFLGPALPLSPDLLGLCARSDRDARHRARLCARAEAHGSLPPLGRRPATTRCRRRAAHESADPRLALGRDSGSCSGSTSRPG